MSPNCSIFFFFFKPYTSGTYTLLGTTCNDQTTLRCCQTCSLRCCQTCSLRCCQTCSRTGPQGKKCFLTLFVCSKLWRPGSPDCFVSSSIYLRFTRLWLYESGLPSVLPAFDLGSLGFINLLVCIVEKLVETLGVKGIWFIYLSATLPHFKFVVLF